LPRPFLDLPRPFLDLPRLPPTDSVVPISERDAPQISHTLESGLLSAPQSLQAHPSTIPVYLFKLELTDDIISIMAREF
jgi:hypothetical protein